MKSEFVVVCQNLVFFSLPPFEVIPHDYRARRNTLKHVMVNNTADLFAERIVMTHARYQVQTNTRK